MCGCCLYNSRFLYDIRFYEQTPPQAGRIPTLPRHSPHLRKYHLDFSSARIPVSHGQGHNGHNGPINQNTQIKLQHTFRFSTPSSLPHPHVLVIQASTQFYPWYFLFLSFNDSSLSSSFLFCPLHPRFQLSPVCIFSSRCSSIHSFLLPFFFTNRLVWWMPGDTQRPIKETDLQV